MKSVAKLRDIAQRQAFLHRLVLSLLIGSFIILLADIRYEHRAVLAEKWESWIPIFFLMFSALIGTLGLFFYRSFGKLALILCFLCATGIGIVGFFLHGKGQPLSRLKHVIEQDFKEPGHLELEEEYPPILAPLAITGLGLLGLSICFWTPTTKDDLRADHSVKENHDA